MNKKNSEKVIKINHLLVLMMTSAILLIWSINKGNQVLIQMTTIVFSTSLPLLFTVVLFKEITLNASNQNLHKIKESQEIDDSINLSGEKKLFPSRKVDVDNIIKYLNNKNFKRICLHSQNGSGKSTFVNALRVETKNNFNDIYIRSWEYDRMDAPMRLFFTKLIYSDLLTKEGNESLEEFLKDLANENEAYKSQNINVLAVDRLKLVLKNLSWDMSKFNGKKGLIIYIDELDRSEANFALELMEIITIYSSYMPKGVMVKYVYVLDKEIMMESLHKNFNIPRKNSIYKGGVLPFEKYWRKYVDKDYELSRITYGDYFSSMDIDIGPHLNKNEYFPDNYDFRTIEDGGFTSHMNNSNINPAEKYFLAELFNGFVKGDYTPTAMNGNTSFMALWDMKTINESRRLYVNGQFHFRFDEFYISPLNSYMNKKIKECKRESTILENLKNSNRFVYETKPHLTNEGFARQLETLTLSIRDLSWYYPYNDEVKLVVDKFIIELDDLMNDIIEQKSNSNRYDKLFEVIEWSYKLLRKTEVIE